MTTGTATTLALKEWDVVVAALEQGLQAVIVRKGGLDDPDGRIPLPPGRFWLMPTLFHERALFLKPEHHGLLVPGAHRAPRAVSVELPRPEGTRSVRRGHLRIAAVAEVVDAVEATSLDALQGLTERTVWTDRYLRLRYRWRPDERPLVIVLRIACLPAPVEVPDRAEYGGCRSWVDLVDPPDDSQAVPVWPEERLAEEVATVRRLLGRPA